MFVTRAPFFRRDALCVDAYSKTAALKKGSIPVQKFTIHQVEVLRRAAKKISRAEGVSHGHALDKLAQENGFKNWSLLQKNGVSDPSLPQAFIFRRTDDEVSQSLRVVRAPRSRWDQQTSSEAALGQTKDLSQKFISPINAVEFSIAYMTALLRRVRFLVAEGSVAKWEMRCWLPYGAIESERGNRLLVNRMYKPVGMTSDDWVDYEQFPQHALKLRADQWQQFAWPGAKDAFLYADICAPWGSRELATQYLKRLDRLSLTIQRNSES